MPLVRITTLSIFGNNSKNGNARILTRQNIVLALLSNVIAVYIAQYNRAQTVLTSLAVVVARRAVLSVEI
jgi:hypothetical protein